MIEVKNLAKKFNGETAVDNISFKIKKGEIVGLLGPNGAGKTTTLRTITGVIPQSKGKVYINNKSLEKKSHLLKKLIGFLPEDNPLYSEMTVDEFLTFFAKIKGLKDDKIEQSIRYAVSATAIEEVFFKPIYTLSKGFKQRVGISQVLLTKPDILILDEPTEGLDPNQRRDIQKLISKLGKKRTVIISSHILSEVTKICNRVIIIHKGKIVADGTPDTIKYQKSKENIIKAEIEGSKVVSTIRKIDGVRTVLGSGDNLFEIRIDKNKDLRGEIYKTCVKNKWILKTLFLKKINLEEIFSQLTKK